MFSALSLVCMSLQACQCFTRAPSSAGVGMSHLSGEVKRLMSTLTKYDQDNYPEMLGRICIINAPLVFKAIWALVKPLLNPRTLSKIQVCAPACRRRAGVHAHMVSLLLLWCTDGCVMIAQAMLPPEHRYATAVAQHFLCASICLHNMHMRSHALRINMVF
jgi:hypothetical protein